VINEEIFQLWGGSAVLLVFFMCYVSTSLIILAGGPISL